MTKITQYSRISHHTITGTFSVDATFSCPQSEDFTDGTWTVKDLALSEIGVNEWDEKAYIRIGSVIKEFNLTNTTASNPYPQLTNGLRELYVSVPIISGTTSYTTGVTYGVPQTGEYLINGQIQIGITMSSPGVTFNPIQLKGKITRFDGVNEWDLSYGETQVLGNNSFPTALGNISMSYITILTIGDVLSLKGFAYGTGYTFSSYIIGESDQGGYIPVTPTNLTCVKIYE